jgi:predicted TIM-barrel fold metal-dependent hydrolase
VNKQPPAGWDCHIHVFSAEAPSLAGHYRPATRDLAEIEAHAAAAGVGHLVLVQPSVYGCDNTLLLQALLAEPGRHRGVAVVEPDVGDAELDGLHAAGVRGIRFNRVSPVGRAADPAEALLSLAPRLRERGWHVQWYVDSTELPRLAALQSQTGLVFVLDHLAGLMADTADTDPAWHALAALAQDGAWIKLSGWYRLKAQRPYAAMQPRIARVAALFDTRMVWGSDWPHTSLDPSDPLPYDATWAPVRQALGAERAEAVRHDHPLALYR